VDRQTDAGDCVICSICYAIAMSLKWMRQILTRSAGQSPTWGRPAPQVRKSEWKINLGSRNSCRSNGSWRMTPKERSTVQRWLAGAATNEAAQFADRLYSTRRPQQHANGLLGRPYVSTVGLLFCSWCFFFPTRNLLDPRTIAVKLCRMIWSWFLFYNNVKKTAV